MTRGHDRSRRALWGIDLLPDQRQALDWIGVLRTLHRYLGRDSTARFYPHRGGVLLATIVGPLGVFDPFPDVDAPLFLELGGGLLAVDRSILSSAACWVEDFGEPRLRLVLELAFDGCLIELEQSVGGD